MQELELTNVARASLEELGLDYEDYLRHRGLALWTMEDPRRGALVARWCGTSEELAAWLKERRGFDGRHGLHGPDGQTKRRDSSQ